MFKKAKITTLIIFIFSLTPLNIISKPAPSKDSRRALATLFLSFGGIMFGATAGTCALGGHLFDNRILNKCAFGFGAVSSCYLLAAIANQAEIIDV